jgi:hypothetical protein
MDMKTANAVIKNYTINGDPEYKVENTKMVKLADIKYLVAKDLGGTKKKPEPKVKGSKFPPK